MKKILSVLIVMIMVLSMASCGGGSKQDNPNAGYYTISKVNMDGMTFEGEDLETMEIDGCYLQLNADGSGEIFLEDEADRLTWTDTEMTVGGDTCGLSFADGVVTVDLEDFTMEFTKTEK